MKILITGGAGYIGYSVVKQLLEDIDNVHSIAIYDNLSRRNFSFFTEAKFDHKPVKLIQGDILDGRSLQKALEGIDCVVHLAARVTTPFADADAHSFDQVNHWGTAQLAYAIEKSSVSKVIYMSSISIYGDHAVPVDEDYRPQSAFLLRQIKMGWGKTNQCAEQGQGSDHPAIRQCVWL